jgi:voltage-gated potassium channel
MLRAVILVGAGAVWLLGEQKYSFFEAVFFAVISVSTVGYGKLPHTEAHKSVRAFSIALIVVGVGAVAFLQATIAATLVEGVLVKPFRRRRMDTRIGALESHLVVAGCGGIGKYVVAELHAAKKPFVIIEISPAVMKELNEEEYGGELVFVIGDATHDHTLLDAGIQRAFGVVAGLTDDRDNLFVTLSARTLNPELRIVSKVLDAENEPKMLLAGANAVVNPNRIGGLRLASELVRPTVTQFLDQMLRVAEENLRFHEVAVPHDSMFLHRTLSEVPIGAKTNLLVVALHEPTGEFIYNPSPDQPLKPGIRLILIGEIDEVKLLREMVAETG